MSGGRIPEQVIAEIRDRTDIAQVIGQHVELRRSGANCKGLCPFHEEKTPSFNVNTSRQFFHCFGCQAGGDVFAFLMRLQGRSFMEVVEELAQRVGVEIPREQWSPGRARQEQQRRSDRQQAIDLNRRVAKLYQRCLHSDAGRQARQYVANRGISDDVSERFCLGYSPEAGDVVMRKLRAHDIDLDFAARIGLVSKRPDGHYRDRFWGRLMFPLVGVGDEVVGFGGRLLGQRDGPKYINTPETPLYRKGDALYGLDMAAAGLRRTRRALLVEGNFDVLQLHQHGFDNAIAPMGTALTDKQVRLLRRFVEHVTAVFDGDAAGRAAARKAAKILVEGGVEATIATLPDGSDPDSLLHEHGADAMSRVLEQASPAVDYLIAELRDEMDDTIPGRAKLIEAIAPVIREVSSRVTQQLYIDRLAMDLSLDRQVVASAVARGQYSVRDGGGRRRPSHSGQANSSRQVSSPQAGSTSKMQQRGVPGQSDHVEKTAPVDPAEVELLKIIIAHPLVMPRAERANVARLLTNSGLRATYSAAVSMQRESGRVDPAKLLEEAPTDVRDPVAEAALSSDFSGVGDPTRALDSWVISRISHRLRSQRRTIEDRIAGAEQRGETTREWFAEMHALQQMTLRFDKARARHEMTDIFALVQELTEVERETHDTQ